jgi:hypothetical protein
MYKTDMVFYFTVYFEFWIGAGGGEVCEGYFKVLPASICETEARLDVRASRWLMRVQFETIGSRSNHKQKQNFLNFL